MHDAPHPRRECADCYYKVDSRCVHGQIRLQQRHEPDQRQCEHFTRASLRFAFFPKM